MTKKTILAIFCILLIFVWLVGLVPEVGAQNSEKIAKDLLDAWSSHNTEKTLSFYTDDCILEDLAFGGVKRGKGEVRDYINITFVMFPDVNFKVTSTFCSGDWCASEWVMSGTHKGDAPKLPATGKNFAIRGVSIIELKDGKIKRESEYYNQTAFLQQVGLWPPPPKPK
jgi:steroid delta-isomerase-like uncharacterized protein